MTTAFISAYLINQRKLEDLIMNTLRTNNTHKVGDLISAALLTALGPNITNNYAAPKNRNTFKVKAEEGDPVRSAERVPYSSSHQLSSFGYAQDDNSKTTKATPHEEKQQKVAELNVAAA